MAFQFSVAARNAALDAIEAASGLAPILTIRTGAVPADCAAADSGTVLATLTLPSDWLGPASGGAKTLLGTWQDAAVGAPGIAAHFRIKQGAVCHLQGTVTATGGGGDMTLDNVSIATGQQVTITAFTLTAGGA
ncbi:MAG: hypothetical protein INF52_05790 [Rhodobacter sp.]|jgi:hypothetical protein|nr:hypothetical protein [Rhodobacter sp.]MCA3445668.1 hypothetical protein [Rhodobacter sp.]